MAQAQLSFHGHKEAVKFFVAVPGIGGSNKLNDKVAFYLKMFVFKGMSAASTPSEAMSASVSSVGGGLKQQQPSAMLVMSGGEGYVDFRIGKYI